MHRRPAGGGVLVGVKPDIVKRTTSHQNETYETKPDLVMEGGSVKRAALNRDSSAAANRLKELSFPDQFRNGRFDANREMNELSQDMGRSTLDNDNTATAPPAPARPERTSTLDLLPTIRGSVSDEEDASTPPPPVARPGRLEERTTTMDAIAASLAEEEEDSHLSLGDGGRRSRDDEDDDVMDLLPHRPGAWSFNDRLTTTDLMQMVNEPIPDDDPELVSGRRQAL